MIHVVALVIGAVVSTPAIIADVRRCIHVALFARFAHWPHGLLVSRLRGRRNATVVCARLVMRLALRFLGVRWRLGGTLGAKYGGCQENEDDQNTQRSCLHTLPPSFRCRVLSVLCPPIAFDASPTFPRAYPSPDVSWAQEPRAAKTVVPATSVYPQRKPVRSRCPRDSCC